MNCISRMESTAVGWVGVVTQIAALQTATSKTMVISPIFESLNSCQ